jgi:hypothetical protein
MLHTPPSVSRFQWDGLRSRPSSGLSNRLVKASLVVGATAALWLFPGSQCYGIEPLACYCMTKLSRLLISWWVPRLLGVSTLGSLLRSVAVANTFWGIRGNHGGPTLSQIE